MNLRFKEFTKLNINEHEMLLSIRNSNYVRNNMKMDVIIELKNHLQWIDNLKNDEKNIYFAVYENDCIVGAVYITTINREEDTCTWGLYFKDNINPLISSLSAFLIIEKMFYELNIKTIYAEVKRENIAAYKFNITLGFKEEQNQDENYYKLFTNINIWENNKNTRTIQTIKKRLDKIEYQFI